MPRRKRVVYYIPPGILPWVRRKLCYAALALVVYACTRPSPISPVDFGIEPLTAEEHAAWFERVPQISLASRGRGAPRVERVFLPPPSNVFGLTRSPESLTLEPSGEHVYVGCGDGRVVRAHLEKLLAFADGDRRASKLKELWSSVLRTGVEMDRGKKRGARPELACGNSDVASELCGRPRGVRFGCCGDTIYTADPYVFGGR